MVISGISIFYFAALSNSSFSLISVCAGMLCKVITDGYLFYKIAYALDDFLDKKFLKQQMLLQIKVNLAP